MGFHKRVNLLIIFITIIFIIVAVIYICNSYNREKVSAFLRVKNEIKTIEACLTSIDGVFDKIVIIHSNEPDDGSVEYMRKWCSKRKYCEIHEYPYTVIPPHDKRYLTGKYKPENTLAAYNNFGLQFFAPEEWVVKIDADQVYIKNKLKSYLKPFKKGVKPDNFSYGLIGYNTFVKNNELVQFKRRPFNGVTGDSYIIKRKYINYFEHRLYYEIMNRKVTKKDLSPPVWFHFMKSMSMGGTTMRNEDFPRSQIKYLNPRDKRIFEKEIRPLLKNSPYYNVSIPVVDE